MPSRRRFHLRSTPSWRPKEAPIYQQYCAECHGASGRDFGGAYVGKVTPIAAIGTDRRRLDSYTPELAVNQATLYAGYPWRFTHFRKTFGYANMPLDGLWLRAPYLHNGSVPSLRDLLEPASVRPKVLLPGQRSLRPGPRRFRVECGGGRRQALLRIRYPRRRATPTPDTRARPMAPS